jgi:hypothetical protein
LRFSSVLIISTPTAPVAPATATLNSFAIIFFFPFRFHPVFRHLQENIDYNIAEYLKNAMQHIILYSDFILIFYGNGL